jgi:hypothetical protein
MTAKIHQFLHTHWPLLLACLFYGLLVFPLVTMRGVAVGADGILYFYPAADAFREALLAGKLPHWTADLQAGFPLLADGQPSVLYPLNALFLILLPTAVAYNLTIVMHGLLGLLLVYAWGRCLKCSPVAAALMGVLFGLTTPLFGNNIPLLEAFAWTPALFLLAERGLQARRILFLGPVTLVLAMQWLAGFPQMTAYALVACSVYVAGRVLGEPFSWKKRIGWGVGWLAACLLSVLLAAPLLLPTYELSLFSIRANGISGAMAGEKSLFPLALISFLLPTTESFWQRASLGSGAYIGAIPFLVALGTFFRKPKPRWFYPVVAMCLVTAVLSFGRFSPLFPFIREVPGLSSFRVPSRFLYFTQFGLITLFGWGWDQLWTAHEPRANRWQERLFKTAIALFVAVSLLGYGLLTWLKPQLTALAAEITFRYIVDNSYHLQSSAYYLQKIESLYQDALSGMWSWPYTLVSLLTLLLGWLLIRRINRQPTARGWYAAGLGILLVLDVTLAVGGIMPVSPVSWVNEAPPTAAIVNQEMNGKLCRLYSHTDAQAVNFQEGLLNLLPANYYALWDISGTGLYSPLGFHVYYRFLDSLGGVNLAFGLKPVTAVEISQNRALLNYLNVCVLTSREVLADFPLLAQVDDVYIYRNEQALPRAFVVDDVLVLAEGEDVVTAVQENTTLLPTTAILQKAPAEDLSPGAADSAQVQVQTYRDDFVAIQVHTEGDVLLQLTDTYYPGWQAELDGEPVEILQTNAQFRAVLVPPGSHQITFTFTPHAFRQGVWAAALAGLLLIIWVILIKIKDDPGFAD